MALSKFKAPLLPAPPAEWDATYIRQLLRALGLYFSQLDSMTPNAAESYTADYFYGIPVLKNVTTTEKTALTVPTGSLVFDTTLGKACVKTGSGWQTITSV